MAAGPTVVLAGSEAHHAVAVRRLRPGEPVQLSDGVRWHVVGAVAEVAAGRLTVQVGQRRRLAPPAQRLVVVQALAKGGRDEDAVAAMTELGADAFVPWTASRCVARWRADRWTPAVREAAKQARRPRFPQVAVPAGTAEVAGLLAAAGTGLVLHEAAAEPLTALATPATGDVVIVVGPEGGITAEELEAFRAAGARVCRLGAFVLRSATAGPAAVAVLSAMTGRWAPETP